MEPEPTDTELEPLKEPDASAPEPEPLAPPDLATDPPAEEPKEAEAEEEATPNQTVPDANDPEVKEEVEAEADPIEEDLARASNGILGKLEGAQEHIGGLRQKGRTLEGWIVELEQFLAGFVGKVKSALSGKSAGA